MGRLLGGVLCEALFVVAPVDAVWVSKMLALADGGADFLCVVQEAGTAGGSHSRPAQRPAQRVLRTMLFGFGFMGLVGVMGLMGVMGIMGAVGWD